MKFISYKKYSDRELMFIFGWKGLWKHLAYHRKLTLVLIKVLKENVT